MDTPFRLTLGPSVPDGDAALAALDDGTADLAIVENSVAYRNPTVRTVAPLYPSVLHIGVRPGRKGNRCAKCSMGLRSSPAPSKHRRGNC